MNWVLRITNPAKQDLLEIWLGLEPFGVEMADRRLAEIQAKFLKLRQFPGLGRSREYLAHTSSRSFCSIRRDETGYDVKSAKLKQTVPGRSNMSLSKVLPTVNQLSHQDKLRLIHFLLLAVAKEAGCNLEAAEDSNSENALLNQLASTQAVVWSPQADHEAVQSLSNLLLEAQEAVNA